LLCRTVRQSICGLQPPGLGATGVKPEAAQGPLVFTLNRDNLPDARPFSFTGSLSFKENIYFESLIKKFEGLFYI
jgi:hypothetical protein